MQTYNDGMQILAHVKDGMFHKETEIEAKIYLLIVCKVKVSQKLTAFVQKLDIQIVFLFLHENIY